MPAPTSSPQLPRSGHVPNPVHLLLGVGLAAVVVFGGLLAWRFIHLLRPVQPAANEQKAAVRPAVDVSPATVVEIAPEPEEPATTVPAPVFVSDATQWRHEAVSKAGAAPPRLPEPSLTADQIIEQRLRASEDDLRGQLRAVPELRLLSDAEVKKARADEQAAQKAARDAAFARLNGVRDFQVRSTILANSTAQQERIAHLFNRRLQDSMQEAARESGLTLRYHQLDRAPAVVLGELSKNLRDMGFVSVPGAPSRLAGARPRTLDGYEAEDTTSSPSGSMKAFREWCDGHRIEQSPGTVPTLVQVLQVEDEPTRLLLVRELTRIKSTDATAQLAGRAIMDLSPAVRRAALAGLEPRPDYEYVPILLRGLSYPWPPVADHAAVALRTLQPRDTVGQLVDLLDRTAPSVPVLDPQTNQYQVREVVRLNHLRNCLLCHASSVNTKDGVARGLVPTPGVPLPTPRAGGGGYYAGPQGDFVRADITFLRQDFSLTLTADKDEAWPREQRFDFVTRQRTVPAAELPAVTAAFGNYPQREAVLYALRGLTGEDAGDSSAKWRALLPLTATPRKNEAPTQEIITGPAP